MVPNHIHKDTRKLDNLGAPIHISFSAINAYLYLNAYINKIEVVLIIYSLK